MSDTQIPEEARCPKDMDFLLLTPASGYTGQLVRLAAVEKGAKWKNYEVHFEKQTNYEPWYMALNPTFDFPLLLHGEAQNPFYEPLNIIQKIDEQWEGTVKLQQACIDNQVFQDRFNQLLEEHRAAQWKTYEMLTMQAEIWLCHWMFPLMFISTHDKAKERIKDKEALDGKLLEIDGQYLNIAVDYPTTKPDNDRRAREFLGKVSDWMDNGNK
jgi:glutathione S-transferase